MLSTKNIRFINERVRSLNTALFYNSSRKLIKFPPSVVRIIEANEKGQMWFAVNKPYQDLSDFDKEFPAELHFYKKELNYFVRVYGNAVLSTDTVPIQYKTSFIEDASFYSKALITLKVHHVEYFESWNKKNRSFIETGKRILMALFDMNQTCRSLSKRIVLTAWSANWQTDCI